MQDETNLNPQPQVPGTNYNPENFQQSVPQNTDFSASTQDFSYFDPTTQPQEPQTQPPTADYYNTGDYANYGTQPTENAPQDFYNQPQVDAFQDPSLAMAAAAVDPLAPVPTEVQNTFTEQKTGNRKLLFIAIGAVVILLIAAGGLVYININNKSKQAETTTATPRIITSPVVATPEKTAKIDNTLTGGDNTPATKAKKNSEIKPTLEWNKKYFTSPTIDADGNCIILETCGDGSDKDRDGLSTIQEYQFGTDPQAEDTDFDGIADGDELFVYYSDPTIKDTDNDTYSDSDEITSCFDPIIASADNFSTNRLTAIGNNVALKTLHEPTIKNLKAKGATQVDLNSKATISTKCLKPGVDTTSDTPSKTNINTQSDSSSN
jgi:hypothetical protein